MNINEEELKKQHEDFYAKARYKELKCCWSKIDEAALEAWHKIPSVEELLIQAAKDENIW